MGLFCFVDSWSVYSKKHLVFERVFYQNFSIFFFWPKQEQGPTMGSIFLGDLYFIYQLTDFKVLFEIYKVNPISINSAG